MHCLMDSLATEKSDLTELGSLLLCLDSQIRFFYSRSLKVEAFCTWRAYSCWCFTLERESSRGAKFNRGNAILNSMILNLFWSLNVFKQEKILVVSVFD